MSKETFAIVLVILLAFLLRFYQLGSNPPGLNLDEAAIGWNAYSILKTGRDEYGQFLPLAFRSHDDYKPSLYIYLTVFSEKLFGINEFAVRFPAALLGVSAVVAIFFLCRQLFPSGNIIPLLSAFLLAISPWHLQFTRPALETGSTVLFTTCGLFFFLRGLDSKKTFYWIASAVFFGLEMYLYQAAKIFVPLFLTFTILITLPRFLAKKANAILFVAVVFLFFLPVASSFRTSQGQMRFQGTSIFQDYRPHNQVVSWETADWLRRDRISAAIFHPEVLAYSQEIIAGYLSHFRPDFLFVGDHGPPINYVPAVGLLYLWELPFILIGIYSLWRDHRITAKIITAWLLLAPLPASVTSGVPSSIRTTIVLPTYQIVTAIGIFNLLIFLRLNLRRLNSLARISLLVAIVYSLAFSLHMLLVHAPLDNSDSWYYGYKDIVLTTAKLAPSYRQIIVSPSLSQPQNFFAFFLKYDPWTYIFVDGGTVSGGFSEDRNHFSKYFFRPINARSIANEHGILYVGKPKDFPEWVRPLKTFRYLSGQVSVIIVGT